MKKINIDYIIYKILFDIKGDIEIKTELYSNGLYNIDILNKSIKDIVTKEIDEEYK